MSMYQLVQQQEKDDTQNRKFEELNKGTNDKGVGIDIGETKRIINVTWLVTDGLFINSGPEGVRGKKLYTVMCHMMAC